MTRAVLVLLVGLAACQPQPRAAAYFEAHPVEAAQVLAACARGAHRGRECETAREGDAAAKAKARLDVFRKGFE